MVPAVQFGDVRFLREPDSPGVLLKAETKGDDADVYYTPDDVVSTQARLIDHIFTNIFEKPLIFGRGPHS